jgi:hypothetical protein
MGSSVRLDLFFNERGMRPLLLRPHSGFRRDWAAAR